MGIFGNLDQEKLLEEDFVFTEDAEEELKEMFVYDELSQMLNTDELREEFFNSEYPEALEEAGIVSKKTLVRLSKKDDLSRRKKMVVFQMAKEANDPLYGQLVKLRKKERAIIGKLYTKYSGRAAKVAFKGQKDYLKNNRLVSLNFIKDKNLDAFGNRIGREIDDKGFRRSVKKK